jgi:cytochrome c oxidase subunit 2
VALCATLLATACTSAVSVQNGGDGDASSSMAGMEMSSAMMAVSSPMAMQASSPAAMMPPASAGRQMGAGAAASVSVKVTPPVMQGQRVVDVTAKNFEFQPNVIHLKKGENVAVRLHSTEGTHGFGSRDLGINVTVSEGQTVLVTIPTDKAGTFSFRCTVPCGPGHMDMTGTIVIE